MKLRILNNSVRLRLSQDDMECLYTNKEIIATCNFINTSFHYKIILVSKQADIFAELKSQTILVSIPTSVFIKFYQSTDEGLYNRKKSNPDELKIAIERDFKCLTPRNEDESQLFPNPRQSH